MVYKKRVSKNHQNRLKLVLFVLFPVIRAQPCFPEVQLHEKAPVELQLLQKAVWVGKMWSPTFYPSTVATNFCIFRLSSFWSAALSKWQL